MYVGVESVHHTALSSVRDKKWHHHKRVEDGGWIGERFHPFGSDCFEDGPKNEHREAGVTTKDHCASP